MDFTDGKPDNCMVLLEKSAINCNLFLQSAGNPFLITALLIRDASNTHLIAADNDLPFEKLVHGFDKAGFKRFHGSLAGSTAYEMVEYHGVDIGFGSHAAYVFRG